MKKKSKLFNLLLATVFASSFCAEPCDSFALSLNPEKDFSFEDAIVHLEHEISDDGFVNSYFVDKDGNIVEQELMSNLAKSSELPSSFKLEKLTTVKDQGSTGTCWAHSAINSAESNLIMKGLADTDIDLSEAHLVYFGQGSYSEDESDPLYHEGLNLGQDAYNYGGNSLYTQGTLAKGVGLVSQAEGEDINNCPQFDESRRYESEWLLSNSNEYSKADSATIKNHIMTKGALSVSYYHDDDYFNKSCFSYYKSSPIVLSDSGLSMINHAVSIVGWDDTFSKENFNETPEGDGAWICKNSWGTTETDDGYFYLSYYDATIADIYSVEVVKSDTYDKIYQYDGSKTNGFSDNDVFFTGANMFTAEKNSVLDAVSFYTMEAGVPYTISISKNDTAGQPMSGELVHTQTGNMSYAGYHIVELDKDITLNMGETFTVSVCLNKTGTMLIGDEYITSSGRSFICKGIGTSDSTWFDMYSLSSGFDIAIKAFTTDTNTDTDTAIDEHNFPDGIFRNYILENCDENKDTLLSQDEIAKVTSIDVSNMGIQQLTGIEYFENLETLKCSGNNLYFLNLENNEKLTSLECENNSFTVYDAWCDQLQMSYLDMSRVTDVKGATLAESNGVYYFIPDKNATELSYAYKCSDKFTATFKLINNYIHYEVADNKCTYCGSQVCAILSLDGQNIKCYYDDLQCAFDSAYDYKTVYVYLCDNVEGNFNINSDVVYLIGRDYTITSGNSEPALKVNSGSRFGVLSGTINNTSNGKALYICENAVTLLMGGVFRNIYTENESLTEILSDGYAFFDADCNSVASDKQSIDFPVMVLPINYTITYELDGGTNAKTNPSSYNVESENITFAEPTREGYTFTGWTYDGQTEPQKDVVIPSGTTGDWTFTANWEKDNYATIKEVSATLSGDIGLNYYINLSESVTTDDRAYVQFTVNGNSTTVPVSRITPEEDGTYKFTIWLTAKEMRENVTFGLYDGNGTLVDIYSNSGSQIEGSTFDYTLETYFNTLSAENDTELKELADATLLYGLCAELAFNSDPDSTVDVSELEDVTTETLEEKKITKSADLPEGLKLTEMTLILKTETALRLYFKTDNISDYTFKLDGTEATVNEIAEEGLYYIEIPNISAKDLDTMYTLTINDNCTLNFNALSYAYAVVKADNNANLSNVVKALYKYNEAANAYFEN